MITTLRKLLADHAKTVAELARITTLQANLVAEEKELLVTTDPEDDQAFRILGAVRLKKDCCPAKIEQLGGKIERLEGEILAETNRRIPDYSAVLTKRADESVAGIAKILRPFYDTEARAVEAAQESDAAAGARSLALEFSESYISLVKPLAFARRFIAAVEAAGLAPAPALAGKKSTQSAVRNPQSPILA